MRYFKTLAGILAVSGLAVCLVGCGGGEKSPRPTVKRSAPAEDDGTEKAAKPKPK